MLLERRGQMLTVARVSRSVMGGVLLAIGLLVLTGLDKHVESFLVAISPDWLITLTTSI
jgi:hypothetical protein